MSSLIWEKGKITILKNCVSMVAEIKISLAMIGGFIKYLWGIILAVLNAWRRPKLHHIEIRSQNIIVRDDNGIESHISYPCLLISFKEDKKIDVRLIKLNNESYFGIVSRDPNYLNQNTASKNPVTIINNRIMPFIKNNWSQLTQRACFFEIKKYEQEVLPLYIHQSTSNFMFSAKKLSHLFFPNKKISLTLNIDGVDWEYGIDLMDFCKVVINNLAFK